MQKLLRIIIGALLLPVLLFSFPGSATAAQPADPLVTAAPLANETVLSTFTGGDTPVLIILLAVCAVAIVVILLLKKKGK